MTDFTNCPIVPGRAYNGANGSKIAVEYGGGIYMLKFPPSGERKPTNLSYTNSCISEHLASSIFNLIGINAQKTELGTFSIKGKTKVVCACKDFATGSKRLFDFCSIKNTILDSDSNGSGTELEDVMDTIDKQQYVSPVELREHFWNVFIVDAELAARLTSYLTRVVYNQRANYIRALMKIKEHECSIEDCDSDIESQSMRSGNSLEESIESKLMWEAIRKYLPKLELKECEVMIALYIDRLSVTATAAKLKVDASTVRRRRDSACDKIRKAMEEK